MSMPIGCTLDNPGTADPIVWDRPADKVRDDIERGIQRIRDQRGLSPDASRSVIATAYVKGKVLLDSMNTASPAQRAADLAAAKRAAFGVDDLLRGTSETDKGRRDAVLPRRPATRRPAQHRPAQHRSRSIAHCSTPRCRPETNYSPEQSTTTR